VFPTKGKRLPWPRGRQGGGGPLLHSNYRVQIWKPFLAKLGLPAVTPHSARNSYISNLQAAGIEVGLVAKLAGHANPAVTLGVYTQAMRGGKLAAAALESAYDALPIRCLQQLNTCVPAQDMGI
jgi:integrase